MNGGEPATVRTQQLTRRITAPHALAGRGLQNRNRRRRGNRRSTLPAPGPVTGSAPNLGRQATRRHRRQLRPRQRQNPDRPVAFQLDQREHGGQQRLVIPLERGPGRQSISDSRSMSGDLAHQAPSSREISATATRIRRTGAQRRHRRTTPHAAERKPSSKAPDIIPQADEGAPRSELSKPSPAGTQRQAGPSARRPASRPGRRTSGTAATPPRRKAQP
jgi:hypothetical protein